MNNTPCIYEFPFRVEVIDLQTTTTKKEYLKTREEALSRTTSVNSENEYASCWDRQNFELIGESA